MGELGIEKSPYRFWGPEELQVLVPGEEDRGAPSSFKSGWAGSSDILFFLYIKMSWPQTWIPFNKQLYYMV